MLQAVARGNQETHTDGWCPECGGASLLLVGEKRMIEKQMKCQDRWRKSVLYAMAKESDKPKEAKR